MKHRYFLDLFYTIFHLKFSYTRRNGIASTAQARVGYGLGWSRVQMKYDGPGPDSKADCVIASAVTTGSTMDKISLGASNRYW